jgi:hypothetical protein
VNWGVLLAAATAVGLGSLSAGGLLATGDLIVRSHRLRHANPAQAFLGTDDERAAVFTEEDLYGLQGVPWALWRIVGTAAGAALAYLLLAERNPILAVLGSAGAFAPRMLRAYLLRRRKADVDRQVRDFIFLLRPALALRGGLHPALEDVAGRLEEGVVRVRLLYHLERAFSVDPAVVIEGLATDLRSQELDNLLLGITAARKGGMSFGEAVIRAADDAGERSREEARVAIEETPVRLLIPMLLLLVPPFLVLALYPLLARLLALLNAPAGSIGGGW